MEYQEERNGGTRAVGILMVVVSMTSIVIIAFILGKFAAYRELLPETDKLRKELTTQEIRAHSALNDLDSMSDRLKQCREGKPTPTPAVTIHAEDN